MNEALTDPAARRAGRLAAAVITALAIHAALPTARATTVLRQSVDTLTQRSATVVRGRVSSLVGHAPVGPGHPFRIASVEVDETLAGSAPPVVFVRVPGGAGGRGGIWRVAGVPELAVGDELVLFLEEVPLAAVDRPVRAPASADPGTRGPASRAEPSELPAPRRQWVPVSLAVGTYRVDRGGDRPLAVQDPAAAGLRAVGPVAPSEAAPSRLPLDRLVEAVRRSRPPRRPLPGERP